MPVFLTPFLRPRQRFLPIFCTAPPTPEPKILNAVPVFYFFFFFFLNIFVPVCEKYPSAFPPPSPPSLSQTTFFFPFHRTCCCCWLFSPVLFCLRRSEMFPYPTKNPSLPSSFLYLLVASTLQNRFSNKKKDLTPQSSALFHPNFFTQPCFVIIVSRLRKSCLSLPFSYIVSSSRQLFISLFNSPPSGFFFFFPSWPPLFRSFSFYPPYFFFFLSPASYGRP